MKIEIFLTFIPFIIKAFFNFSFELFLTSFISSKMFCKMCASNIINFTHFFKEDEEPLEPDELPEHLRPQPQLDLTKVFINRNISII